MLLKILKCTGQLPRQKIILSKVSVVLMLKNPDLLDLIISLFFSLVIKVGNNSMWYQENCTRIQKGCDTAQTLASGRSINLLNKTASCQCRGIINNEENFNCKEVWSWNGFYYIAMCSFCFSLNYAVSLDSISEEELNIFLVVVLKVKKPR